MSTTRMTPKDCIDRAETLLRMANPDKFTAQACADFAKVAEVYLKFREALLEETHGDPR